MSTPITRISLQRKPRSLGFLGFAAASTALVQLIGQSLPKTFLTALDDAAGQALRAVSHPLLDRLAIALDLLGSTLGFALLTLSLAALFMLMRRPMDATLTLASTILAWGLNTLFKNLFDRPRPALEALLTADGYSFPSGNATIGAALIGFAAFALIRESRSLVWRSVIMSTSFLIITLLGLSRVYAGVHYITDIIGGSLLGLAVLLVMIAVRSRVH